MLRGNVMAIRIDSSRYSKKNYWYWVFALMPFLIPDIFLRFPALQMTVELWTYISFLILLINIVNRKGIYLNSPRIVLLLFYLSLFVSTVINHGAITDCIVHIVKVLILCFTIEDISDDDELTIMLYTIRDIVVFFFLINIGLSVVYPHGIPSFTTSVNLPALLYGNVNVTARSIFPGIAASAIIDGKKNRISLSTIILIIGFVFLCVRVYMMATGLISLAVVSIWIIFRKIFIKRSFRILIYSIVAIAFVEFTVVVFYSNQGLISFVTGLFGKDLKFTNRYYLWYAAVKRISESLIYGHGALTQSAMRELIGNPSGSHNYYLDVTLRQGFVGLAAFLFLIIHSIKKLSQVSKSINTEMYMMIGFIISLLLMFLGEPIYEKEHLIIPVFYMFLVMTSRYSANTNNSIRND